MTSQQEVKQLEAEAKSIAKQLAPLQVRMMKISDRLELLREEQGRRDVEEMGENPNWGKIINDLSYESRTSTALRRYAEHVLRENFGLLLNVLES